MGTRFQSAFATCLAALAIQAEFKPVALLFFQVELAPLYKLWSGFDPVFEEISRKFTGVRMLRQDPTENIFSFICSANNNIKRSAANFLTTLNQYWQLNDR